jgi:chemotaxis protein MotA
VISIIGILVVIGAIVGGYLREHGKLFVLMQPAKLVIIGGAAIGTTLIANPLATILKCRKDWSRPLCRASSAKSSISKI